MAKPNFSEAFKRDAAAQDAGNNAQSDAGSTQDFDYLGLSDHIAACYRMTRRSC